MDDPDRPPDALDTVLQIGASLIPYAGGSISIFMEHERQRFQARVRESENELVEAVGRPRLLEALGDERRARLLVRAIIAVGASDWEEKRRALGSTAAAVLEGDDAELDDSELLVEALADLDRPHIAALARMALAFEATPVRTLPMKHFDPPLHPSAWSGLIRHGAISPDEATDGISFSGAIGYGITTFGRDLLALLRIDPFIDPED